MFPNHFAIFIWRKKFGAWDHRVFFEHVGNVQIPMEFTEKKVHLLLAVM
jgi:hypothetical protein